MSFGFSLVHIKFVYINILFRIIVKEIIVR